MMSSEENIPFSHRPPKTTSRRFSIFVNDVIFFSLALSVVALVIPFGGVDLWARMAFAVIIGILLIIWALNQLIAPSNLQLDIHRIAWPASLFLIVCGWIYLQSVSFTPEVWHHPIWGQASAALQEVLPGRISINPEDTIEGLISFVAIGMVFFLAYILGRHSRRADIAIKIFIVSSGLFALYGIISQFGGSPHILGQEKRFYLESVTSTFVNRNSYATFAGLGLLCSVAYLVDRSTETFRMGSSVFRGLMNVLEALVTKNAMYFIVTVVLFTALLLTQSRAGNASFIIGLVALMAAMMRAGIVEFRRIFLVMLLLAPVLGIVISVSGAGLGARMSTAETLDYGNRETIFEITKEAIEDRPFLGTGLGTFREAIYSHLNQQLLSERSYYDAHNTYLEKILELGVPAALAIFATILMLIVSCLRGLRRRRRHQLYPAIAVGAGCLIATHSLFDFSIEVPAIAVSFTFLLGIGVAQSFPRARPGKR